MSGRLCTASSLRYAPIRGSVGEVEAVAGTATYRDLIDMRFGARPWRTPGR
jgi:hypothetical protein